MKPSFFWALLLGTGFSLFAQVNRSIVFFIPPVIGEGIGPEDNDFITDLITKEIAGTFTVADSRINARYALIGSIFSREMYYLYRQNEPNLLTGEEEEEEIPEGMYVFHIVLQDNRTGAFLAEQDLAYLALGDLEEFFSVVLATRILSTILTYVPTLIEEGDGDENGDGWRNKKWYIGTYFAWTPRVYSGKSDEFHPANLGFGISGEWHFRKELSAEAGLEATVVDWVKTSELPLDYYRDTILEIPLIIKYVFKPKTLFMLEPYTGFHFNISMYGVTGPAAVSWRIGFQYGMKLGPGILTVDPRFAIDLYNATLIEYYDNSTNSYQRYLMYLGVGYKYGIK